MHRLPNTPPPWRGNPAKIISWGFSISENNYKHGAKLTLLAGNFRLTRSSECWVDSLKMLTPAITAADNAIKINLSVSIVCVPKCSIIFSFINLYLSSILQTYIHILLLVAFFHYFLIVAFEPTRQIA